MLLGLGEGSQTNMDKAHGGRQEDRDAQARKKMKSQTCVCSSRQRVRQEGQTGRKRRRLYLRGPSACSAAMRAASWQDTEPTQLTHVESMQGARPQG